MDAIAYLDKAGKMGLKPLYVLHGDEDFLKRQIKQVIVQAAIGDSDPEFAVANYLGEQVEFVAVRNELETLPFLCERRIILIDQADPFVTKFRAQLESLVNRPTKSGILVLDVKSWPSNTRLAKAVPDDCSLSCKAPPAAKLIPWVVAWAKKEHGRKIDPMAAELLIENAGTQMGLLTQEISKLVSFVGENPQISRDDVEKLVGRSRSANVFKILDAIGEGDGRTALTILRELFEEGEEPIGILAALGTQIRRLAQTAYYVNQKLPMEQAMDRANVMKWPQARQSAVKQLKHLGRQRLGQLYNWLVETDLGLKGGNPLPPRIQLERLVVKMAKARAN
ncbi:DNA polymerase III subunit delta [Telmatocola sphagniphila]|uniref:DNA polymerase III subunit delta n=1 Tax=Telmatocola sphagniphila TaxID=1123043 RepID=A0A8E6EYB9_9BACT|nr:DNA polymerase III subunit delta [Telmatocola sphagniphila]QVL32216.1 DNA polymerase III subunit delta [Telmatocola sphagniphila]